MNEEASRILVIDDNPKNLDVLADLLDKKDFIVLFALDGASGLQRAITGQPDIILLDIMMPGIDGFETCRRLQSNPQTQDIPVMFMTALSETLDKVKGFECGAVDYITKPIQPEEVLARINTHLKIQRLQRHLAQKNEELEDSNQQLQQALVREQELNKLKSRIISIASHEFRAPLSLINITSGMLKRYAHRMSDRKKLASFDRIDKAVSRLINMLDDILILAKAETANFEYKPEPIDLVQFCRTLVEEFQAISEETHTIKFSANSEQFYTRADPNLLQHVLSNLLSNAIKYSPAGSMVECRLQNHGDTLSIVVVDQGIGISEDDQLQLFHAFHRGSNVGKIEGTGLGLSIAKQFIELHGGTIRVESQEEQGTTCLVTIPLHQTMNNE